MDRIQKIHSLNSLELSRNLVGASWHSDHSDSAWVYFRVSLMLTEGDLLCLLEQYGTIIDLELVRDPEGQSRGFGFACYRDQRSTVLAVDNLTGFEIDSFKILVDHARYTYKDPERAQERIDRIASLSTINSTPRKKKSKKDKKEKKDKRERRHRREER